jgi:hypothetical protein
VVVHGTGYRKKSNARFSESAAWLKESSCNSLTSSVAMYCISERTKEEIKPTGG